MKKLVLKTSIFILPFFLVFIIMEKFYTKDKGDLLRLGYIIDIVNYDSKMIFKNDYLKKLNYSKLSETEFEFPEFYDFITIGDSFSDQNQIGYQNFMVSKSKLSVLDIDKNLTKNPIQDLHYLINAGFFDKHKTKYVILQNVEREFVERGININRTEDVTLNYIKNIFNVNNKNKNSDIEIASVSKEPYFSNNFFSRDIIFFTAHNINYLHDDNAIVSQTYKVNTTKELFLNAKNNLLFFQDDLKALTFNNNKELIHNLNGELNFLSDKLAKLNIKLIVLPAPDKYSVYYDYIVDKEKYEKPILFDYLNTLKRKYIYINSKMVIKEAIKNKKDVYFYDDTHWSPIASELIASEILRICI